jgi:hypothetical protein
VFDTLYEVVKSLEAAVAAVALDVMEAVPTRGPYADEYISRRPVLRILIHI